MKKSLYLLILFLGISHLQAQDFSQFTFSRKDSLRGALRPERTCYNVRSYNLNLTFNFENKSISGYNDIYFTVNKNFRRLQVDLFENMVIDSIKHGEYLLKYTREFDAVFIELAYEVAATHNETVRIYYHGSPIIAKNAPWDGGFVWSQDNKKNLWVSVACEGLGASCWWPNKDHLSDEPDSMNITLTVPKGYDAIANGKLVKTKNIGSNSKSKWHVSYPINNYNVSFYIGKFAHIHDEYNGLALDYYVLSQNKGKASKHFKEVAKMLEAFEHYFGPYPFKNDGYKMVEAPYWGMEHQSAIAYGNNYKLNKWSFDFILVHESGHEWWGNNVGATDHADLWLHEAFCTYSEALYVEYFYGYEKSVEYLNEQKLKIEDNLPIKGPYDVNFDQYGSADMYYKGTNMLHTLRTLIEDDELWFSILKGIQKRYAYQTVNSSEIINYISQRTGKNFSDFFNQYVNYANSPTLEYVVDPVKEKIIVHYRYTTELEAFDMPVKYTIDGQKYQWLFPKATWKRLELTKTEFEQFAFDDKNFMVFFKENKEFGK